MAIQPLSESSHTNDAVNRRFRSQNSLWREVKTCSLRTVQVHTFHLLAHKVVPFWIGHLFLKCAKFQNWSISRDATVKTFIDVLVSWRGFWIENVSMRSRTFRNNLNLYVALEEISFMTVPYWTRGLHNRKWLVDDVKLEYFKRWLEEANMMLWYN